MAFLFLLPVRSSVFFPGALYVTPTVSVSLIFAMGPLPFLSCPNRFLGKAVLAKRRPRLTAASAIEIRGIPVRGNGIPVTAASAVAARTASAVAARTRSHK